MPSGSKTTDADSCISHTKYILKRREEHYFTVTDVTLWLLHSNYGFCSRRAVGGTYFYFITSKSFYFNHFTLTWAFLFSHHHFYYFVKDYCELYKHAENMYKIYVYILANIKPPILLLPSGPKTGHCQRPPFSSYLQLTLSSSKSNYHTAFHGSHFLDFSS